MSRLKYAFGFAVLAVLAGVAAVMATAAISRLTSFGSFDITDAHELPGNVWVTEQLIPGSFTAVRSNGFRTIIDLRPDGEDFSQPLAATMQKAAQAKGLYFAYIPVLHGDIPVDAVNALTESLAHVEKPILLYCRSGKRAARTWALVEASRSNGLDVASIKRAVESAGQSVEDLIEPIKARIAARKTDQ